MPELPRPSPALQTEAIILRPWTEADVPAIVEACSDAEIVRFLISIPSPYTTEDALRWLADQEPARRAGTRLDLAIEEIATGSVGGSLTARVQPVTSTAELGYWLASWAQGRGYMTTAVRLLCAWLFEGLGMKRIELTTLPDNVPSQRVARRCGFTYEGRLRSSLVHLSTGARHDSLVWSLLPGELTR